MTLRRGLLGAAVTLAVLGVLAAVVVREPQRSGIDAARHELEHGAFSARIEAAETLARVAEHLGDELRRCRTEEPATRSCPAIGEAAGYTQVLAAHVLGCPLPARRHARAGLAAYLEEVAGYLEEVDGASPAAEPPPPPPLPRCAHR